MSPAAAFVVYQDAMKKRVRAFTEGVVMMVCPVLLAVALKKVDMKSEGNGFVRGSISPLAALTLEAGLLPFLCLCLCLSNLLTDGLSVLLFRASKLLVHLCALLLMALAYGILLLISMKNRPYLTVLVLLVPFTLWRCYWSVRNSQDQDAMVYQGCDGSLKSRWISRLPSRRFCFWGWKAWRWRGRTAPTRVSSACSRLPWASHSSLVLWARSSCSWGRYPH